MYQGLGQMLTIRLQHHQGCSETPKCAYVIYGQPLRGSISLHKNLIRTWGLNKRKAFQVIGKQSCCSVVYKYSSTVPGCSGLAVTSNKCYLTLTALSSLTQQHGPAEGHQWHQGGEQAAHGHREEAPQGGGPENRNQVAEWEGCIRSQVR